MKLATLLLSGLILLPGPAHCRLIGDFNADNQINILDVVAMLKYLGGDRSNPLIGMEIEAARKDTVLTANKIYLVDGDSLSAVFYANTGNGPRLLSKWGDNSTIVQADGFGAFYKSAGAGLQVSVTGHGECILFDSTGTLTAKMDAENGGSVDVSEYKIKGQPVLTKDGLEIGNGTITSHLEPKWCSTLNASSAGSVIGISDAGYGRMVLRDAGGIKVQVDAENGGFVDVSEYKIKGVPVLTGQGADIPAPTGGVVQDVECRAQLAALLAELKTIHLLAEKTN